MQIVDGLLSRRILDASKQVTIPCQELAITTSLHEMLVWRKRDRHRVKSNEVNDGMQVVHLHERPFLAIHMDPVWLLRGLSLYQEYDEEKDVMQTYLYKFPKDEESLKIVSSFLEEYALPRQVDVQGIFVVLEGEMSEFTNNETLLVELTHAGHSGLFSFLCGLVLAYGTLDRDDDVLNTIHMSIPLVGSIVARRFLIDHMLSALRDMGMYIQVDIQNQKYGQVMQLMITDWEVLKLLSQWLEKSHSIATVSKFVTYQQMKPTLIEKIQEETGEVIFLEKIGFGVVKLLRKK